MQEVREFFARHPEAWGVVERTPKNERAKEALRLVAGGMSCKAAAEKLGVSASVVSVHCRSLHRAAEAAVNGNWMKSRGFPNRAINVLFNWRNNEPQVSGFDGSEQSLRQLLSTWQGYERLLHQPNMGKKTLGEVLSMLGMTAPTRPQADAVESVRTVVAQWKMGALSAQAAMEKIAGLSR